MPALSAFHSRILPLIPTCPIPTVDQALIDACIEMCEQGSAVHRELDTAVTIAGTGEIDIDLPSQSKLVRVTGLRVDGRMVEPRQYFEIDGDAQGFPRMFSNSPDGTIAFYPIPDAAYSVRIKALLKPARNATAVDDILFDDWAEFVVSGAMYRLLSMPAAPWANPQAAKMYFDNFRMGVNRSELEFMRERNTNEMRVQPVWV